MYNSYINLIYSITYIASINWCVPWDWNVNGMKLLHLTNFRKCIWMRARKLPYVAMDQYLINTSYLGLQPMALSSVCVFQTFNPTHLSFTVSPDVLVWRNESKGFTSMFNGSVEFLRLRPGLRFGFTFSNCQRMMLRPGLGRLPQLTTIEVVIIYPCDVP